MHESWKKIPEFEGIYEASSNGRIRSCHRFIKAKKNNGTVYCREIKSRILKQFVDKYGYLRVGLIKTNRKQTTTIAHRLVAMAFLKRKILSTQINHKNGIKTDNRICNLEWVTASQNVKHSFCVLGRHQKTSKPVIGVSEKEIVVFKSIKDAEKNGFTRELLSKCARGLRKSHKGFKWRFA